MDRQTPNGIQSTAPMSGTPNIQVSPSIAPPTPQVIAGSPNIASPDIAASPNIATSPNIVTFPNITASPSIASPNISTPVAVGQEIASPNIASSTPVAPIAQATPEAVPIAPMSAENLMGAAAENIGNDESGMIDLTELANMSEEDLAAEVNGTPSDNFGGVEDLADDNTAPAQLATLSEEEIAAREAAQRAESEASLAEASASMQNLHQNIMPEKKKEEKIEASISSKARKKIKLSLKTKIIIVFMIIAFGAGGTLAYLITSGYFNYKNYALGDFTVRIDESKFESSKDGNKLKVKSKEGGLEYVLADLGQINHTDLLEDVAGMNRLFADIDMKVESSTERTLSTAQCAVYKTYHKTKKYSAFIAFCNVGDYMIQIDATSDENGAKAEQALIKAGEVVSAAKHK